MSLYFRVWPLRYWQITSCAENIGRNGGKFINSDFIGELGQGRNKRTFAKRNRQ